MGTLGNAIPPVWLFPYEDTAPPPLVVASEELFSAVVFETRMAEMAPFATNPTPVLFETTE